MALHLVAESAFHDLLAAWRAHDSLRHKGPTRVRQLGDARVRLDLARERMRRLRKSLYPTAEEVESVLLSTLCPTLDEVVHLTSLDRYPDNPEYLVCVCGQLVPRSHPGD